MVRIWLYVEGGGNDNARLKRACREGFHKFLTRAGFVGRMPKIVACGSRNDAFESFQTACNEGRAAILLVDAEDALRSESPTKHLLARDNWKFSPQIDDEQVHLMVQCMENWFLADTSALAQFYGQGFQSNALPKALEIESVTKQATFDALEQAARNTKTKGRYHKGRHSYEILQRIDPNKVRKAAPYVERLFVYLDRVLVR
jgi:hypothetical protein